jgi:16S rRNA (guanine966-N2)-methyltransferase
MRIIAGKLKGRQIETPLDLEIRPTSDRCKESMFNVIEARKGIRDANILDLFAGTGNLGFEAISRGAAHVTAVDKSPESARMIRAGAKHFNIESQLLFIPSDIGSFISKGAPSVYDIIFADPPYDWPDLTKLPDVLLGSGWLDEDGWFLLEHDARHSFIDDPRCVFAKPYGRTIVSIFLENPPQADQE